MQRRVRGSRISPRGLSGAFFCSWTARHRSSTCSIPSQKLADLTGQQLPPSLLENVRFAFIKKDATLRASPRKFDRYGECGMELSDLLPHIATCADDICLIRSLHTDQFNHHPAALTMQCGRGELGAARDGKLAGLWPGERVARSAGLCGANRRPGNRRQHDDVERRLFWGRIIPVFISARAARRCCICKIRPACHGPLRRIGLDALHDLNEARSAEVARPGNHQPHCRL